METIKDIVADIREQNLGMPDDMECVSPLVCDMLRLADRIEKAYKLIEGLSDGIVERDQYIAKLTEENERLKAALQPVLDIVMDSATSDLSMEMAITEAKRIWKEGEKS